jgi:hypothetical protein
MTKEFIECLSDEVLLSQYADCYGQTVFCPNIGELKNDVELLKAEILRRMKKN